MRELWAVLAALSVDRRQETAAALHDDGADPLTTHGEARAIGTAAGHAGWESIVVVTSPWHVTRARLLVRQCFDGDVAMVPTGGFWQTDLAAVVRELVAVPAAVTVRRAC